MGCPMFRQGGYERHAGMHDGGMMGPPAGMILLMAWIVFMLGVVVGSMRSMAMQSMMGPRGMGMGMGGPWMRGKMGMGYGKMMHHHHHGGSGPCCCEPRGEGGQQQMGEGGGMQG